MSTLSNLGKLEHSQSNGESNFDHSTKHPYAIRNGRIVWFKPDSDPRPLCNFTALIISEEIRDDGLGQKRYFMIEGRLEDGSSLPPAVVTAEEFPTLAWVTKVWGAKALVFPGSAIRDHLRAAIQMLSDCKSVQSFAHTGWRKVREKWMFMHGNGAIGKNGNDESVVVNLSSALGNYEFPDPSKHADEICGAVKKSLKLLDLGEQIGFPILGIAYLAPLTECLSPDFSVFISGATGGFKSCITALVQAHFGRNFNDRTLPGSWSSTPNALEMQTSLTKNSIFTIDDFKPGQDRVENAKLFQKADRIFRGVGNQAGRGRLSANAELKATPVPRCVVIASGEDIPPGHSCRARLLIIEVKRGDILKETLTVLQKHARDGEYVLAMASFIQWVAARHEEFKESLPNRHQLVRSELQGKGEHFRTVDAIAKIIIALEMFVTFAIEVGALSEVDQLSFLEKARSALTILGARQDEHQSVEDPCTAVIDGLRSLLSGGSAHLLRAEDGEMPFPPEKFGWAKRGARIFAASGDPDTPVSEYAPQGPCIGWVTTGEILLNSDLAYGALERLRGGVAFNRTTLWKRMKERKLLICEKGKTTSRRTVHSLGRTPVVVIAESVVYPVGEQG